MIAFETEDVAGRGGGVAAGGQSDAAEQVEADPDTPGVVIRQVRDPAQPLGKAQDGDKGAYQEDNAGHNVKWGQQRLIQRGYQCFF